MPSSPILIGMKINMRTIQQALNIGQRVYREWNKHQNKKARETAQQQSRSTNQPAGYAPPKEERGGNFGNFGGQQQPRTAPPVDPQSRSNPYAAPGTASTTGSWQAGGYPGDYFGSLSFDYTPVQDGKADPGEVVWAWVPFEEDYQQGKDRPVVIVGREGTYLLALMLTSKDHNNAVSKSSNYVDIGSGVWDKEGRESEVKLDRVIRLNADSIRREGAIMPRETFDLIANAYRQR